MTSLDLTTINDLERTPEEFYSRLNGSEAERRVKEIVGTLKEYMAQETPSDYLIAGVGGILRFDSPTRAQDIDLAVVGLKYTTSLASRLDHSFENVIDFTNTIVRYFSLLNFSLLGKFGKKRGGMLSRGGSGPFGDINERYIFGEEKSPSATTASDLESFG